MDKLCLFFVVVILSSAVLGLCFGNSHEADDSEEIDDPSYGWDESHYPFYENERNNPNGRADWPGNHDFPLLPCHFPGQFKHCLLQRSTSTTPTAPTTIPTLPPVQSTFAAPTEPTTVQTPSVSGATTQSLRIRYCIRICPVTPEFNPVCGSNGITYGNPGKLQCAQTCGVDVTLVRSSPCPTTAVAPS